MRTVDLETWSRREQVRLLSVWDSPHCSLCANVDLTAFYPAVKQRGISFTVATVYVLARAANAFPEFRYRIRPGAVVSLLNPAITRTVYLEMSVNSDARRTLEVANELGIPVFVNLDDYDDLDKGVCQRLRQGVSVIQKSAAGPSIEQAREMAQTFYDSYSASLCVLTMGRHGVVYTNPSGTWHLSAHDVKIASTSGAGATFSAGLIYGRVHSWSDDETVAFANALAARFCSNPEGISCSSAAEVIGWAASRKLQLTKLC